MNYDDNEAWLDYFDGNPDGDDYDDILEEFGYTEDDNEKN